MGFLRRLWISFSGSLFVGVVFFPSSPFMGFMLFPSLWLGNASGRGGGGGGWRMLCAPLLAFLPSSSPSPIPLFFSFLFFFSFWLHCFLICFFFFLSPLSPSFFPLLLLLVFFSLCLSPLSPFPLFFFFEINHFLFHPPLFLLLK